MDKAGGMNFSWVPLREAQAIYKKNRKTLLPTYQLSKGETNPSHPILSRDGMS